ncbi:MAG: protein TolA [Betaproteobacteria bacterium]|nr:MAG: protein TolA [Betaproteobacteria bacterium]
MSVMASLDSEYLNQRLLLAGVLALLVHLAFFIFMTFGLSWKTYPPAGVVVDLWSELPQPALRPKPIQPPRKIKPLPLKTEKTPALIKPKPALIKPDIVIKKEKIKKPKPVEKKQQTDRKQKERIAAEVDRLQKKQQEEEKKLQEKEAGAQATFKHQLIDEYKAKILAKIKSRIVMPPDLPHDPVAEFDVTLLPGGEILDVKMRKSSGYIAFDRAVERAIVLSRPLPLPPDPRLFPSFRNLSLKVHYLE